MMRVQLVVVQGRPAGKRLSFSPGTYYFGRGDECHVRPLSEWVSRQHCRLRVTPHVVLLRDLGSRNGTLVNGILLTDERRLADGDQVQLGPLVFEVRLDRGAGHDTTLDAADPVEPPGAPLPADGPGQPVHRKHPSASGSEAVSAFGEPAG